MKYLVFVLVLFQLVYSEESLEEVQYNLSNILQKIDNTKFGKSLLDTVNLQMSQTQGVNEILKVLDEMRDTMNEQKERHEADHQRFQQYCAKDIDFYEREIAESTVNVVDIERKVEKEQEEIAIIYSSLNSTQEQIKVYQDALEKLNQIRLDEFKDFKETLDEHDITTAAIEEAKRYFVQIRGDISFLQTRKNVLVQLTGHFQESSNRVKSQKNKALFHILAGITQKAQFDNKEVVTKILELCNRVLENIQDSRMKEEEEEQQRVTLYEAKKKVLDDNISDIQKIIDNLTIQLKAMEENLSINLQYREEQMNRKEENQKLRDSRETECTYELQQFGEQREKTLKQIQTVEQVITIAQTNLAVMKQYLTERKEKYAKH